MGTWSSEGIVYVLTNRAMPGYVKIGYTQRNAHHRASELSKSTSVPSPFEVAFELKVDNAAWVEQTVHIELNQRRVGYGKEFFAVSVEEAVRVINESVEKRKAGERREVKVVIECPKCHQKLRVPTDRGKIRVACQSCPHKFEFVP